MCVGPANVYPLSGLIDCPFPCFMCYAQDILFVNISSSDSSLFCISQTQYKSDVSPRSSDITAVEICITVGMNWQQNISFSENKAWNELGSGQSAIWGSAA
jgi:hypothetical protein